MWTLMKSSMLVRKVALAALVGALGMEGVLAQTPAYQGELLLQPAWDSAKCLTAASNSDGAAVTLQGCTGAPSQKWLFEGGSVKVHGKCLDVPSGANADGTKLAIYTCTPGNANQQWVYTWWDNHLSWKDHGKCVDLSGGNTADGTPAQIWGCGDTPNQIWNTGYMLNALPKTSQKEQYGTNQCGTGSDQNSNCQTAWINSAEDFCVWAPPSVGTIGDTEREEVAWCTKSGRGTRLIPDGTLKGVHFVKTPDFVQITGIGNFTSINIPHGDSGGELDNRGSDGRGNPIGGLLYGDSFGPGLQYHEWTNFMSDKEFCFRACKGPNAAKYCNHIYDEMGCYWNMPANYDPGFENCDGDDGEPMGVYGTSMWHQGVSPTPPPHPAPSSSNCKPLPTVSVTPARVKRSNGFEKQFRPRFPTETPAPRP